MVKATFLLRRRGKNKLHLLIACIKNIGVPSGGDRDTAQIRDLSGGLPFFVVMLCLLELGKKKVTFLPEGKRRKQCIFVVWGITIGRGERFLRA